MNKKQINDYECPQCKTESGHCYGDNNLCTCGCRFVKARQMASEYFLKDVSNIRNEYIEEFKTNPKGFIEKILNEFGGNKFEKNSDMYAEFLKYLENFTNGDNLNTRESKIKLS